jgi:hypothetical protein
LVPPGTTRFEDLLTSEFRKPIVTMDVLLVLLVTIIDDFIHLLFVGQSLFTPAVLMTMPLNFIAFYNFRGQ